MNSSEIVYPEGTNGPYQQRDYLIEEVKRFYKDRGTFWDKQDKLKLFIVREIDRNINQQKLLPEYDKTGHEYYNGVINGLNLILGKL